MSDDSAKTKASVADPKKACDVNNNSEVESKANVEVKKKRR